MRAYAINLRISVQIARCAVRLSRIPRTAQHVARPEGLSPGGACGVAAGRGVSGGESSTSTSTVTGRDNRTGSLNNRVLLPGTSFNSTRKSCVIHSSAPCWTVLTNAEEDAVLTQNCISTSTVFSTVRLAAKPLSAPPMAMMAMSPAITRFFISDERYASARKRQPVALLDPYSSVTGVKPSHTMPSSSSSSSSGTR